MNSAMVRIEKVTKIYNTNDHRTAGVLKISLKAYAGEMILILGPSGSGKTTLLTLIAGFVRPSSGSVLLFNEDIKYYSQARLQKIRATKIGFVFQAFRLIEALNVKRNIELCLHFGCKSGWKSSSSALDILEKLGVRHLADRYPGQLSQGEKQRVAIARAIANDARLILADEPTASLDKKQGIEIIRLLHHYARSERKCVFVASHDLRLKNYADRIFRIENGAIVSES